MVLFYCHLYYLYLDSVLAPRCPSIERSDQWAKVQSSGGYRKSRPGHWQRVGGVGGAKGRGHLAKGFWVRGDV